MSTENSKLVPIPADSAMNGGLNSPHNNLLLDLFGKPRAQGTQKCMPVTNRKLLALMETRQLAPHVHITAAKPFLDALERAFAKANKVKPDLISELRTEGGLCCRLQRNSEVLWSNHAFGFAGDFYYGEEVVPYHTPNTHEGLLELYPYIHNEGLYWGAEFDDAMHIEAARQTLIAWRAKKLI